MAYKYLVAAALQEELIEFTKLLNDSVTQLESGVELMTLTNDDSVTEILTFSANKMGMAITATRLTEIVIKFNPQFTFFIGTCAGLKDHPIGSVLIPQKVFSYESGKYTNRTFEPDYWPYETGETLRKQAENLWAKLEGHIDYKVFTDEDLCSGGAVIDNKRKVNEIKKLNSRKVSGLEMEAYAIACINHSINFNSELLVIKGISDLAAKKWFSEKAGNKILAKQNCADFTFKLICYLEERNVNISSNYIQKNDSLKKITDSPKDPKDDLRITFSVSFTEGAVYKLKLKVHIRNESEKTLVLKSLLFQSDYSIPMDPVAESFNNKPNFLNYKNSIGKDVYDDVCIIKPHDSVKSSWLAVDPKVGLEILEKALVEGKVGVWTFQYWCLDEEGYTNKVTLPIKKQS